MKYILSIILMLISLFTYSQLDCVLTTNCSICPDQMAQLCPTGDFTTATLTGPDIQSGPDANDCYIIGSTGGSYTFLLDDGTPCAHELCHDVLIQSVPVSECRYKVRTDGTAWINIDYVINDCDVEACSNGVTDVRLRVDFLSVGGASNDNCVVTHLETGDTFTASNLGEILLTNVTSANSGTYEFVCTLANGCTATRIMNLTVTDVADLTCTPEPSCIINGQAQNNGEIVVTTSDGSTPDNWVITPALGFNGQDGTFTGLPPNAAGESYTITAIYGDCETECTVVVIDEVTVTDVECTIIGN